MLLLTEMMMAQQPARILDGIENPSHECVYFYNTKNTELDVEANMCGGLKLNILQQCQNEILMMFTSAAAAVILLWFLWHL